MVDMFVSSVSRVRRIDEMVIPQLKLKRSTLMQFDKTKHAKVLNLSKMIGTVIDQLRTQPDLKVMQLGKYSQYLEISFDQLLLELKMKTVGEQHTNVRGSK